MSTPRNVAGRTLYRGGQVYAPGLPFATAMLVEGPTITWVGDESGADAIPVRPDEVVRLDGRLVTPGFVDAHVHLAMTGFALHSVDLGPAHSLRHALELLSAFAARDGGPVLFAYGWDESHWPDGRGPTRAEIDRAVGNIPAYVARVDFHSAVVSSALMAADASITRADGWSDDGRVEREAHHLARDATDALRDENQRRQAIATALDYAASRGITSVHELNAPHIGPFSDFSAIEHVRAERPRIEVVPYWGALFDRARPDDSVFGYAGDLNVDGAIGSRTAAMHRRYEDADTTGHLYLDRDQVRDHVVACTRNGIQAGFHVIGDAAMTEVTEGLRAAADVVGGDAMVATRHRLEHVEMPAPDQLETLASLGVVASVQPAFDAAWGATGELYEQRLGEQRAGPMNPFGSMMRAGITVAFGSDSPITPMDPWGAVRAAVLHHRPEERISVRVALDAHTRGGHRARRDDDAGGLRAGATASFAVWQLASTRLQRTPLGRSAAQATDADNEAAPMLPDLAAGSDLPTCVETVVSGRRVYGEDRSGEAS